MATRSQPLLTVALCGLAACVPPLYQPTTRADIGSAGGTVTVTEGLLTGTSIAIPAGAMPRTLTIEIIPRPFTVTPDTHSVSFGAADFQPFGLRFSKPATLTLRFDPDRVPTGTADGDFIVKRVTTRGASPRSRRTRSTAALEP